MVLESSSAAEDRASRRIAQGVQRKESRTHSAVLAEMSTECLLVDLEGGGAQGSGALESSAARGRLWLPRRLEAVAAVTLVRRLDGHVRQQPVEPPRDVPGLLAEEREERGHEGHPHDERVGEDR